MKLTKTQDVIAALGGINAVAELTGRRYSATWHWGQWDHFPSNTFLTLTRALEKKGRKADERLWNMAAKAKANGKTD